MSDAELYRVLYFKDGAEALTDAEPYEAVRATAQRMHEEGYDVAAVMTVDAGEAYLRAVREGPVPAEDPFAPDLTMSREVADFILRSTVGLFEEGYWPKGYDVEGRHGGTDGQDYDDDMLRRAADIVGRNKIKHAVLLRYLAELDADAGETT